MIKDFCEDIEIEFDGERGIDGISPTVEVSREGAVTIIKITDAEGAKTAEISDGVSPTVEVEYIEGGRRISVTDASGTKIVDVMDGRTPIKGVDYTDGKDGYTPQKYIDYFDGTSVEIRKIISSTEDGGENIVEFSDGKQLTVRNGQAGYTPQKNVDYFDGADGKDGYTPVKGVDYFDGKDGTGVTILGSYATEDELKAAHLTGNAGDAYMVDGNLYVWSATENAWVNVGNIKGETGADGFSPTVVVSKADGVTTVEITDKEGTKTATINDGAPGKDGESISVADYSADDDYTTVAFSNGDVIRIPSGVGIQNIRLSKESDTGNTYEVELTNGQSYEFVAPAGPTGKTGADGVSVKHSWDGTVLSVTSASGTSSADLKGEKGEKGDTPVAGVDFFTEAEKTEMLAPVTELAEAAQTDANDAKSLAREALNEVDEVRDTANDAQDTATAAMESLANYLPLSGGTMTGDIYLLGVLSDGTNSVAVADIHHDGNATRGTLVSTETAPTTNNHINWTYE